MTPLSSAEAFDRYPDKAARILAALARTGQPAPAPESVTWFAMLCHDDPDQPLDEAACASLMRLGQLPAHRGLLGRHAGREACLCDRELMVAAGQPA